MFQALELSSGNNGLAPALENCKLTSVVKMAWRWSAG